MLSDSQRSWKRKNPKERENNTLFTHGISSWYPSRHYFRPTMTYYFIINIAESRFIEIFPTSMFINGQWSMSITISKYTTLEFFNCLLIVDYSWIVITNHDLSEWCPATGMEFIQCWLASRTMNIWSKFNFHRYSINRQLDQSFIEACNRIRR